MHFYQIVVCIGCHSNEPFQNRPSVRACTAFCLNGKQLFGLCVVDQKLWLSKGQLLLRSKAIPV